MCKVRISYLPLKQLKVAHGYITVYVCMCVCVCVCVCMCVWICVCMCVCMCVHACVCITYSVCFHIGQTQASPLTALVCTLAGKGASSTVWNEKLGRQAHQESPLMTGGQQLGEV